MAHYGNESKVLRELKRAKLMQGEKGGFTEQSSTEMQKEIKRDWGVTQYMLTNQNRDPCKWKINLDCDNIR